MKEIAYPIRAVSKLTGLSIDTLRAWERRYKAISPARTGGGRTYREADIVRLKRLKEAVDEGHRIGDVARLSDQELAALLRRSSRLVATVPSVPHSTNEPDRPWLRTVLDRIERFDQIGVDHELARLAALMSPREFVHQVVVPLMQEVGDRWYSGSFSVAQEHMVSATLRNLLGGLLRSYERIVAPAGLLFATPRDERHEFGILAAAMLAAAAGLYVVYLGPSLPPGEILAAAARASPKAVVLGAKGAVDWPSTLRDLQTIATALSDGTQLWIGGVNAPARVRELKGLRAVVLNDMGDFERHLIQLGGVVT